MKRPTPDQVIQVISELGADGETVSMRALVAKIWYVLLIPTPDA